jgi:hypothetical protein
VVLAAGHDAQRARLGGGRCLVHVDGHDLLRAKELRVELVVSRVSDAQRCAGSGEETRICER